MKQGIRLVQWLVVVACSWSVLSCKKKPTAAEEIDFGVVKDSVYRNDYFGFRLSIPAGWHVQDREENRQMMDQGGEMLAGDDRRMKASVKATEMETVPLLTVFEQPVGAPAAFNSNLICVAERLPKSAGVKTASDYFQQMKKVLAVSKVKIDVVGEKSNESLNGAPSATMETTMNLGAVKVRQKYHAVLSKGYAVSFILTFTDGDAKGEAALQDALATLKWDK